MATYNPDIELFRTQVESIRAQTDRDWVCLISDDCSEPERFEAIAEVVGDDDRFVLSRSEEHLGFYRNFERALEMVPAEAEFVALSDQDDRWYPDKLEALREAIGSAELAYSDLRRVDADGTVRAETLWEGRRNNHTQPRLASDLEHDRRRSCLFRRRVIEHALPFPDGPGWDFHDHWLALVAMALGEVAYVDRPLYDYVQHPGAVLGQAAQRIRRRPGLRDRLRDRRGFLDRWRSAYFSLYLQREFHAADPARAAAGPSSRDASAAPCGSWSPRLARRWPSPGSPPARASPLRAQRDPAGWREPGPRDPLAHTDHPPYPGRQSDPALARTDVRRAANSAMPQVRATGAGCRGADPC